MTEILIGNPQCEYCHQHHPETFDCRAAVERMLDLPLNRTKPMDELLPCPFPHEVKRGPFLDIDEEDFFIVRGACGDCGACGPFVNIDDQDKAGDTEKAEATRLWNTRALSSPIAAGEADVERVARIFADYVNIYAGDAADVAEKAAREILASISPKGGGG